MKKFGWLILLPFLVGLRPDVNKRDITVFISGVDNYKIYRIPAVIKAPDGDLLAFAEGRKNGSDDFGHIEIVMKRSKDKGKTWGNMTVVASNGDLQAGNPAPVVDYLDPDYPQGRIFLFYNTGNNHEGEIRKGKGIREVYYKTSTDGGFSWSNPVNITRQVHKPNQPGINPAYNFEEDWRSYANTPGHAMQFNASKYKGRIFVAANHSKGETKRPNEDYFSHGFYTDDHGKTFKLSETIFLAGSNESSATELSNGSLILNMRNQKGDIRSRIVALSKDGGSGWDTIFFDHNLPDPVCQGTILTVGSKDGKNILAFCNAADTRDRNNLTLRISYDEGATWKKNYPVDVSTGSDKANYTAYSDIVSVTNHQIGVLYEKADYSRIVFKIMKWK